jgi:hypothetical protein
MLRLIAVVLFAVLAACDKGSSSGPVPAIPLNAAPNPAPVPTPRADPEQAARDERIRQIIEGAASDAPDKPWPPTDRAHALAGIAQLQALLRARVPRAETDEQCEARHTPQLDRFDALRHQIGKDRITSKTRFSSNAPWLRWTVEDFALDCIGCVSVEDGEEAAKDIGPSCNRALAVLSDLNDQVKASK